MWPSSLRAWGGALFALLLGYGCGPSTNILGLLTPQQHKESFENALAVAQAAYDSGDMGRAQHYAKIAYDLDNDSEAAAVLYGFVNLSLAGGDPFRIANALQSKSSSSSSSSSSGGTSDTLGVLKPVIGLTADEFAQMGTMDNSDPTLPVIIPRCAEDVRATIAKLAYLNAAIVAVCPFVDQSVHILDDIRQNCALHDGPRDERARSHFLWAFAHITEALAFNSVLSYSTADPTGKQTNLELRVAKIHSMDTTTNLPAFLTAMQSLTTTLQAVMPTSGACSATAPTTQLRGVLDDLLAVDAAFSVIKGTPDKIKASIQASMAKIKAAQSAGSAGTSSPTQAMKGDLTKKMSKTLTDKLDALAADPKTPPLTADQKNQLCASYATIASGSGQTTKLCQ